MLGMDMSAENERGRTQRKSRPFVSLLAGGLALALCYAVSYLLIATPDHDAGQELRSFNHEGQAKFFGPAVEIGSAIRPKHIEYCWWSDDPHK
jgi:hypothetical protein